MDKSPEAFRTISEVADALDVPPHVLRFWETRFTQVKPVKRGGGRRYYRPEDVRLLRGIRGLLYDDGMTIKGVQKILREKGLRHVVGLGTPESEAGAAGEPAGDPAPEVVTERPVEPMADGAVPERRAQPVPAAPQPDLFAVETVMVEVVETEVGPAAGTVLGAADGAPESGHVIGESGPRDRAALRRLVADLVALRAVMADKPAR